MPAEQDRDAPLRVAIVGGGPKGLFALERLLSHARAADCEPALDVELYEPHPHPGAGPVYDPRQPGFLRMNFAAELVNAWAAGSRAVPAGDRFAFVDWRRGLGGEDLGDRYPPRALVGRYLADALARMQAHAPRGVRIAVRPLAVGALERRGRSWTVVTSDGAERDGYDEVLVATGHRTSDDDWPAGPWPYSAALIPAVFPVGRRLSAARVVPGSTVAVRGFALTFIDAALALTEGRGGTFAADDHPYRLRYTPGRDDAGLIVPFARTGRPMLAKPEPALAAAVPGLEAISASARARILALRADFDLSGELLAVLAAAAGASLLAAGGRARERARRDAATAAAGECLAAAAAGAPPPTPLGPAEEIARSLDIGAGLCAPDLQWALGHTWRAVYPALVTRLGGDGLAQRHWPAFRNLAAQMERIAFGPPAVNAAKLLALIAARRVELGHVAGGRLTAQRGTTAISSPHGEVAVDAVVNAVLPEPGALRSDTGLLEALVGAGHARLVRGRRGLEVAADARCIGGDGQRTTGLSAIGRPTEDCVIGNDTLSRTLHPHADLWARRVVARSTGTPLCSAVAVTR